MKQNNGHAYETTGIKDDSITYFTVGANTKYSPYHHSPSVHKQDNYEPWVQFSCGVPWPVTVAHYLKIICIDFKYKFVFSHKNKHSYCVQLFSRWNLIVVYSVHENYKRIRMLSFYNITCMDCSNLDTIIFCNFLLRYLVPFIHQH